MPVLAVETDSGLVLLHVVYSDTVDQLEAGLSAAPDDRSEVEAVICYLGGHRSHRPDVYRHQHPRGRVS